ncbi:MAG: GNAT family N-acetyltransferase [Chloroflexi bacterium]|nr:MAG: GNAT family N-acetyltransferase [Chloroflexota bacterium]
MEFDTTPASNYPLPDLVKFLNRGFEAYFVPIQFDTVTFLNMLRKDGIDLTTSRVLLVEDQPCGIALIARRGWVSRLAAMGIAKEARGKGAGSWFMDELIREARQRDDREMTLEVIEQNEPAVKLYRKSGFQTVRRLVGFTRRGKEAVENGRNDLWEVDLREMAHLVSRHGLSDLPWQLSGESIAQMNPPARAYRKGQAYVAVSNPMAEHVAIWALLVEQDARGHGQGIDVLKSVIANHPGKTWHVPAIFPEEFGKVFEQAGFEREELSQWQMKLDL